ncbi:carbohydrate-binding protein [Bacteroidota bacterium]
MRIKAIWRTVGALIITIFYTSQGYSQGYLHADGKNIVDGSGENFIIRSVGTGNWLIQEGYMMKTEGIAGTQHKIRERLNDIIGQAKTDTFYMAWLDNHFTRRDVDSLKAWGFNAIRPALHYKWFTLPIEDEPIPGQQTWLETGFRIADSLVQWCTDNEMYVIFDMHGAPGGQGKNADISDYDPSKPSLWESEYNKTKLVALWYKIAERFADQPWVGGYDLINETNWPFPEGNNAQLRNIYLRITDTIRLVDTNHMVFIEGNGFANDFGRMTPPWDDNLVYSFHKYWSYNNENSFNWVLSIRDQYNVPLWLGESGENSNTWFTNLISLAERTNIGWSWWPVKKESVNNPMRVLLNDDYTNLVEYWKGNRSKPSEDEAYAAVMTWANNHNIENCVVQRDVIDAMFRQPHSTATIPYNSRQSIDEVVFATEYDLGRNGYAYYDKDTANYSQETGSYAAWNQGYSMRNDGVDIEACQDSDTTNGYNVGWTGDDEWLVYSMHSDSAVLADGIFRSAGASGTARVIMEANGRVISERLLLSPTGGWQTWRSAEVKDVLLPAGDFTLKVRFIKGGANVNYFRFTNFRSPETVNFKALYSETSEIANEVHLHFNKEIQSSFINPGDFTFKIGTATVSVDSVAVDADSNYLLKLYPNTTIPYTATIYLNYSGTSLGSDDGILPFFSDFNVENRLRAFPTLPAKVQAESFIRNNGFVLEDCDDIGGGQNTGYANNGDFLDYIINVPEEDEYLLTMRVALNNGNASVKFLYDKGKGFEEIKAMSLTHTGGWQSWKDQTTNLSLPEGKYTFRIYSLSGEHNINWFSFAEIKDTSTVDTSNTAIFSSVDHLRVYPNPVSDVLHIDLRDTDISEGLYTLRMFNISGREVYAATMEDAKISLDVSEYEPGVYFLEVESHTVQQYFMKVIIQ